MKPICVPCQCFFRPKKNGVYFVEGMPTGKGPLPTPAGTSAPELWQPYKLWIGDLWHCLGCGAEIIVGVNNRPFAEHYQPDFAAKAERVNATLQINDC